MRFGTVGPTEVAAREMASGAEAARARLPILSSQGSATVAPMPRNTARREIRFSLFIFLVLSSTELEGVALGNFRHQAGEFVAIGLSRSDNSVNRPLVEILHLPA